MRGDLELVADLVDPNVILTRRSFRTQREVPTAEQIVEAATRLSTVLLRGLGFRIGAWKSLSLPGLMLKFCYLISVVDPILWSGFYSVKTRHDEIGTKEPQLKALDRVTSHRARPVTTPKRMPHVSNLQESFCGPLWQDPRGPKLQILKFSSEHSCVGIRGEVSSS